MSTFSTTFQAPVQSLYFVATRLVAGGVAVMFAFSLGDLFF